MPRSAKPKCTACGVCCISPVDQPSFCDVEPSDERRLGKALVQRYVVYPSTFDLLCMTVDRHSGRAAIKTLWTEEKSGPLKTHALCRCAFLQGSLLEAVKCKVYEKRPRVCRLAMKPGDRICKRLRVEFFEVCLR